MKFTAFSTSQRVAADNDVDASYRYCTAVATSHYENFPVASILFPARLRKYVFALYAFARIADDFADEEQSPEKLHQWRAYLHQYPDATRIPHPVFPALFDTISRFQLPLQLLDDLITAFLMDAQGFFPQTWNDLITYSRHSANPVGRLFLYLMGQAEEPLFGYSDAICTALQLTNFWQDLSIDLPRGRCYLPATLLSESLREQPITQLPAHASQLLPTLQLLIEKTARLYQTGLPLLPHLHGRFRREVQLILNGGVTILHKTRRAGTDIFSHRPKLTWNDWVMAFIRPAYRRILPS